MADDDTNDTETEAPAKGKKKLVMMAVIGAVLAIGGGVGVPMVMKKMNPPPEDPEAAAEAEVASTPAVYYPILPPLTTNFSDDKGRRRFMQLSFEVMARNQSIIDEVKNHDAAIRNALLLAFSDVTYDSVETREGKEALRILARDEVQKVLEAKIGEPGIDDIYFTSLIIQ